MFLTFIYLFNCVSAFFMKFGHLVNQEKKIIALEDTLEKELCLDSMMDNKLIHDNKDHGGGGSFCF